MASAKMRLTINPPDVVNKTRTALVTNEIKQITSEGGWYSVESQNRETSGECGSFIGDPSFVTYYAAVTSKDGTFQRAVTPWIYFPKGFRFAVRGYFTAADRSGLNFAKPLD